MKRDRTIKHVPARLRAVPQWVCWTHPRRKPDETRRRKVVILTSSLAGQFRPQDEPKFTGVKWSNPFSPECWLSFEDALLAYQGGSRSSARDQIKNPDRYRRNRRIIRGIGFVVTRNDPFVAIDLDHCRDRKSGLIESWAQHIIDDFNTYAELSPSGTGVHIFLQTPQAVPNLKVGKIEVYYAGQFLTFTGKKLEGCPDEVLERQAQLEELCRSLRPPNHDARPSRVEAVGVPGQVEPPAGGGGGDLDNVPHLTDDEVIALALRARNSPKFRNLFLDANWGAAGYRSQSEADLALCRLLYFWTGGWASEVQERIDRLFRRSALYRPDKWNSPRSAEGETYGSLTIKKAVASNGATWKPGRRPTKRTRPAVRAVRRPDFEYLVDWPRDSTGRRVTASVAELAKAWGVNRSTALRRIKDSVTAGFAERVPQPGGARARRAPSSYRLSRKGRSFRGFAERVSAIVRAASPTSAAGV